MKNLVFKSLVLFVFMFGYYESFSQNNQQQYYRNLYYVSKVWGLVKYYHSEVNQCRVDWDQNLLNAVNESKNAVNDSELNVILENLLKNAGTMKEAVTPVPVIPDSEKVNLDFGWIDDNTHSEKVRNDLMYILENFRPGPNCFAKLNDYSDPNNISYVNYKEDIQIPEPYFPQESYRLFILIRYWNTINYFYPNKDIMDIDWNTTLKNFIPQFSEVKTPEDYHLIIRKLHSRINDSHGFIIDPYFDYWLGYFVPPFKVDFIENKTVVVKVKDGYTKVKKGDVILKINGIDFEMYRNYFRVITPSSNKSALERDINMYLFRGSENSTLTIETNGAAGSIEITRNMRLDEFYNTFQNDTSVLWKVLPCDVGYVNMGKLVSDDVPFVMSNLLDKKAIVFDVRNYPNGTIHDIMYYLLPESKPFALFTIPDVEFPGRFIWDMDSTGPRYPKSNYYNGKVIILHNELTQSHAEYTIMAFETHHNAVKFGSQTAGADGNISRITMPGDMFLYFSNIGVYYPDKSPTQRIGIVPDTMMKPTIKGLITSKDEVLEKANDCLTSVIDVDFDISFNIIPNPSDGNFTIESKNCLIYEIKIIDLNGNEVIKLNEDKIQSRTINMNSATGFYYIICKLDDGSSVCRKMLINK